MISSLVEGERLFDNLLRDRKIEVEKKESRIKPGNSIYLCKAGEVFHIKYTKTPFKPDPDKSGPARELHLKLHYSINTFQYRSMGILNADEKGTMIGIDEDLLLNLMNAEQLGKRAYIVTILERDIVLWIPAREFYNFVMRHDTFIKFPRSGVPVCYVPTGYFLSWSKPIYDIPSLCG